MVSKYSLLFDVKFQSMFPLRQKKAAGSLPSALLQEKRTALLMKDKPLERGVIAPVKA